MTVLRIIPTIARAGSEGTAAGARPVRGRCAAGPLSGPKLITTSPFKYQATPGPGHHTKHTPRRPSHTTPTIAHHTDHRRPRWTTTTSPTPSGLISKQSFRLHHRSRLALVAAASDWIPSRDIREATGLRPEGPFQWSWHASHLRARRLPTTTTDLNEWTHYCTVRPLQRRTTPRASPPTSRDTNIKATS